MLKQIDLKTAIDLVLFQQEEVKMIRPAERWKDSKLYRLNDLLNDLDTAVFLYDVEPEEVRPEKQAETAEEAPKQTTTGPKMQETCKKDTEAAKEVPKETPKETETAAEPEKVKIAPQKAKVKAAVKKIEKKPDGRERVTVEDEKKMAKMRLKGDSVPKIAQAFGVAENTVRAHLDKYAKAHRFEVAGYYRQGVTQ